MNHKRIAWIVLVCVGALALAGCAVFQSLGGLTGSGNPVTEEYDFTGFSEIELGHAFEATITPGDTYAVSVTVDDNLLEHLVVEQDGARLRIGLEQDQLVTRATLRAEITLPALTLLDVSGATPATSRLRYRGPVPSRWPGRAAMRAPRPAGPAPSTWRR